VRIAFCADVHLANHRICGGKYEAGLNDRCRLILDVLEEAVTSAYQMDCDALIIAGDLFDTTRPSPQIIAATGQVLTKHPSLAIDIIVGNHDRNSDHPQDHALGPLGFAQNVRIWSQPALNVIEDGAVILMPFQAGPAKDWLPVEIEKIIGGGNVKQPTVLVTHLGLHDQAVRDANFWAEEANDAIDVCVLDQIMLKHGIQFAMSGNWHGFAGWKFQGTFDRCIYQIGALVPTGWDNPGLVGEYGSLLVLDTGSTASPADACRRNELGGPRFVNVSSDAELEKVLREAESSGMELALFVRWNVEPEQVIYATHRLAELKSAGLIRDFDVRLSKDAIRGKAQQAAQAAKSSETLAGALAEFVKAMPLEPGIDRQRVFNRAREYLR